MLRVGAAPRNATGCRDVAPELSGAGAQRRARARGPRTWVRGARAAASGPRTCGGEARTARAGLQGDASGVGEQDGGAVAAHEALRERVLPHREPRARSPPALDGLDVAARLIVASGLRV